MIRIFFDRTIFSNYLQLDIQDVKRSKKKFHAMKAFERTFVRHLTNAQFSQSPLCIFDAVRSKYLFSEIQENQPAFHLHYFNAVSAKEGKNYLNASVRIETAMFVTAPTLFRDSFNNMIFISAEMQPKIDNNYNYGMEIARRNHIMNRFASS